MTAEVWVREFVKLLIARLIIPKKVIPSVMENRPAVDEDRLKEAAKFVETKVAKSIDSLKVFQADLFLARIPNLEFLEVMILLYYFVILLENQPALRVTSVPKNELQEVKKILRAFGIERSGDLDEYQDTWKQIWQKSGDKDLDGAFKSFETMKTLLDQD